MASLQKDPNAILDYGFDWTTWLGSDAIDSSDWAVEGPAAVAPDVPLTITPDKPAQVDGARTKVWVHGGVVDASYSLRNRIRTVAGRQDDRSMTIVIRQK